VRGETEKERDRTTARPGRQLLHAVSQNFAPRFMSAWVDLREHNHRRRMADVEDCVSENRPKLN